MTLDETIKRIQALDLEAPTNIPLSPDEYDLVRRVQRMPSDASFVHCAREPGHEGTCAVGTVVDGVPRCARQSGKLPDGLRARLNLT
jgi:hypothetical protein